MNGTSDIIFLTELELERRMSIISEQTRISEEPLLWNTDLAVNYLAPRPEGPHPGIDRSNSIQNQKLIIPDGFIGGFKYMASGYEQYGAGYWVVYQYGADFLNYFHMKEAAIVPKGGYAYSGDKVGIIGTTGNSTGPHIHFEVRTKYGDPSSHIDPSKYIFYTDIMKELKQDVKTRLTDPIERLMGQIDKTGTDKDKELKANFNETDMRRALSILSQIVNQ